MMKTALISFILLGCSMSLSALSLGGLQSANWTSEDIERGYKIVGDIAYKVPDPKDQAASLLIHYQTPFSSLNKFFILQTRAWGVSNIWPGGRVPFVLSPLFTEAFFNSRAMIRTTMSLLSLRVDNCVRFVQKTSTDLNYVDIIPSDNGCYSYVCAFTLKPIISG